MVALGKSIVAGTLALGTLAWGGGMGWQQPHNNNSYDKGSDGKHASYGYDHKDKSNDFYSLKYEERKRLCSDDNHWLSWVKHNGGDRDKYCEEFDHKDYGNKHDDKQYGWNDNHGYGWDGNDRSSETAYVKDEHRQDSYSEKKSDYEKTGYMVEASSSNSDNYNNRDKGWGHGYGDNESGYSNNETAYKAAAESEKQSQSAVEAMVDQRTIVNNYTYINGNNNVVNNNISVANTASVTQSASSSETNSAVVEYTNSSNEGSSNGYGKGYGDDSRSSSDESFKLASYSEKSSSSEVKQSSSYSLNESYTQVENEDDNYGYGHDKDWNKDHDKDYGWNDDEDCEEYKSYEKENSDY